MKTKEQLACRKLFFEALSKIPKRFIDGETTALDYSFERVFLANPKFPPMVYKLETHKWEEFIYETKN
jgi:hypothetical protein